jgi:hypothetical protein
MRTDRYSELLLPKGRVAVGRVSAHDEVREYVGREGVEHEPFRAVGGAIAMPLAKSALKIDSR